MSTTTCKSLPRARITTSHTTLLPRIQTRPESTTRRLKKLLHLPSTPSYTPSTTAPSLIYNPPSSAPSAYHTPPKFLPQDDKRKKLYAAALQHAAYTSFNSREPSVAAAGTPLSTASFLPPKPSGNLPASVRPVYEKKYHLGEGEIEEIRRLRVEDPVKWSRERLAEKFGCSQFFVGMVAKHEMRGREEGVRKSLARERWGGRRKGAREDRLKRREGWGRDL